MTPLIREILSSASSLHNEEMSFSLALYVAMDINDEHYHYRASSDEKFILQLVDFYINRIAAIDVYGANMFSKRPIHLLKYRQPFNNDYRSTLAFYSNGAVCIDQSKDSTEIHVWIKKPLVDLHQIPKPDELDNV